MCTLYLPSLLYAVISLLFNCPQSARAVVTDTLSLTSPPVNPNCELGLRVQRPHDAPDCRSPPARRRNATELTVNKVLRSQPGRVPWSDASDQQHRRTRRGLPRADGRARARASRRGSAHILSDSQIAVCTTISAWASRKCKALVERNRRTLAALRAQPTARQCGSGTSGHMPATE